MAFNANHSSGKMIVSLIVGIFLLGMEFCYGASIPITDVQIINKSSGSLNNRGDQLNAIDGKLDTIAHMTPPFTTGPQIIAYNFGDETVTLNRIRVAKIGDITSGGAGSLDHMDLKILFTTDTGPMESRSYRTVSGLVNGYLGTELIKAQSINTSGTVIGDHHNYSIDGFYSLSFDDVQVTGLALEVARSTNRDSPWVHYGTYEFQAYFEPLLSRRVPISNVQVIPHQRQDVQNVLDGDVNSYSRMTPPQEPSQSVIRKQYRILKPAVFGYANSESLTWFELVSLSNLLPQNIFNLGANLQGKIEFELEFDSQGIPVGPATEYVLLSYDSKLTQPSPNFSDEARIVIRFPKKTNVSRLRIYKKPDGDLDGRPDKMNLQLYYATPDNTGDFSKGSQTIKPVRGMHSGIDGREEIKARIVSSKGEVIDDVHESSSDGFYSLTFLPVETSALVLSVKRAPGDVNPFVYYNVSEIQAFYTPSQIEDHAIVGVDVFKPDGTRNNRGDSLLSVDNSIQTAGIMTPPFSAGPHIVSFDLGQSVDVNQIRVAKAGDTQSFQGGNKELMDLEILYTTDTGPLNQRSYRRVSGLVSGDNGQEKIKADSVHYNGFIENDKHDFLTDGFYTLSFNKIHATAIAIKIDIDPSHQSKWVHYPTYDFSAFYVPGGGEQVNISDHRVFRYPSRSINQRSDSALAFDGNTSTSSFLTPSGSLGEHLVAVDFQGDFKRINRLRIAKDGDSTGEGRLSLMDLEVFFTLDSGPLENRNYYPIQSLRSGFNGAEKVMAGLVLPNGRIDNDSHDFNADGYYSLSFPSIEATGIAIGFTRDTKDPTQFSHLKLRDLQVLLEPDGVIKNAIKDIQAFEAVSKKINNRGDAGLAVDNDLSTLAHFTAPGSQGAQIVAYNLNSKSRVNRIRVAKIGDTNGGNPVNPADIDKMNLEILYTTSTGPLVSRSYQRVKGLRNGFFGIEKILADQVLQDGRVIHDQHDFSRNGFYSLTFDTVNATAIAIQFSRADGSSGVHYGTYEFHALHGPDPIPDPGTQYFGNVINLDIQATGGGAYSGGNAAGHHSPAWNIHDPGKGNTTDKLKDANGNSTQTSVQFDNVPGRFKISWTSNDLLEDYYYSRSDLGESKATISGLNSSSHYDLYLYTGVVGGVYRVGQSTQSAVYIGTGPNGDSAYADRNPMVFIEGKNYVRFPGLSPASDGTITVFWKFHPNAGQVQGHLSGLTLVELSTLRNPVHFDVSSSGGSVYQGPSVLNDGLPVWNSTTSDINRALLDSSGFVTSLGLQFSGANGRFKTQWSEHPLLADFLFRDSNALADCKVTGLNPNQIVDIYIYSGVEGGEYWIGNSVQRARFDNAGPGNDRLYAPNAPWSEGKNYVKFKSIHPSSQGEISVKFRHNPNSLGSNGNLSGLTIVPSGKSFNATSPNRQIVNLDIQPPNGKLYSGPNVLGQAFPRWNAVAGPHGSAINIPGLVNSLGIPTSLRVTAEGANGAEITSWTDQSLIGDYLYRDRNGIARVGIHGLNPSSQYNIYVHPGPEGGQFTIGNQSLVSRFSGSGVGGDPAYRPGPSANFVDGKTLLLFPGVSPDSSGSFTLRYTDSPLTSAGFALLSGMTIDEVSTLSNPVHIDIQATQTLGEFAWIGPSVLLDKPYWNAVVNDFTAGLSDSGGGNTSVGLRLQGASNREVSSWTTHNLLKDGMVRKPGNAAGATLFGLDPQQYFDLYLYTGTRGGRYLVGNQSRTASYTGSGINGDPDYSASAPYKNGKNYVQFSRVSPNDSGVIEIEYIPVSGHIDDRAHLSGLSLVPVGYRAVSDPLITTQFGVGGGLGGANPSGLSLPPPRPQDIVLQAFSSATMSVEQFVTGTFEAGKYETIQIVDKSLEALGIAALTLRNVILEVKGTCAHFTEGSFSVMGFEGRLSNIECDRYAQYPFKSRMFVKVPLLGEIDADFWMGLGSPQVLIVGGEFSVPGAHNIGPLSFSDLRVAIDPRNNRFGAQGAAGFKGKFVNIVQDIPCPLTISTSKRFGGGIFFQNGSLEEVRLIGNNLQKQLGPNRVFLNKVNLALSRDPKLAHLPIGDNNWLFKGISTIGIGCPIEIKGKPLFPITVDGTLLFGSTGDINLSGDGKILGEPLLGAKLATNWKNGGSATLGANFSLLKAVTGSVEVGINSSGYSGLANVTVKVPDGVPLVSGREFVNQTASFRDGGVRGVIKLDWGKASIKCVGPYTRNLPSVPYPCGKWYAPRICYWTPTVTVPRVCYPTVEKSKLNIKYVISGTTLDFGINQTNMNRPIYARSMMAPMAMNDEGTSLRFFSNFKAVDRVSRSGSVSRRSLVKNQTEEFKVTLSDSSPGAVFTLFFENEPADGINYFLHFPDGEKSVEFVNGDLPDGFDEVDGFSTLQQNPKSASIYIEDPQIGDYRIEVPQSELLGDYSLELIVMEPELEIDILNVQPGEENGVFEITYEARDHDKEAHVEILVASSRDGLDVEVVDVFLESEGVHSVLVDLRDLGLNSGRYYLGASIHDTEGNDDLSISERPYRIVDPNAPDPISEIVALGGDKSISVSWAKSDDTRVTEYLILYSDGLIQSLHDLPNLVAVDASQNSATITDLENGLPYLVSVVAFTENGLESEPFEVIRVIPSQGIGLNPPTIISNPEDTANVNAPYLYIPLMHDADTGVSTSFLETDPDNTPIVSSPYTWSLVESPSGMTMNDFGAIQWTPTVEQLGPHKVILQLEELHPSETLDFEGLGEFKDTQEFEILVVDEQTSGANKEAPWEFLTSPVLSAVEGMPYVYMPVLWGPQDTSIAIEIKEGPDGLSVNGESIVWNPEPGAIGAQTRIEVTTSTGDTVEQNWYLDVVPQQKNLGVAAGTFQFAEDEFIAQDDSEFNVLINRLDGAFGFVPINILIIDNTGQTLETVPVPFGHGQTSRLVNIKDAITTLQSELDLDSISLGLSFTSGVPDSARISDDKSDATIQILNVGEGEVYAQMPKVFYPWKPMDIQVQVIPAGNVGSYQVVEVLPDGWIPLEMSHNGQYFENEQVIIWGEFHDNEKRDLTYSVLPPPSADSVVEFSGWGLFDSFEFSTNGERAMINRALYEPYAKRELIEISPFGPGSPYPSSIRIESEDTLMRDPIVGIHQLDHPYYNDLNIVLQSPEGDVVNLTGNVDLLGNPAPVNVIYYDGGETPHRFDDQIQSSVVKPLNEDPEFDLAPPAPQGPYTDTLSSFINTNPNGDWNLFVMDSIEDDGGQLSGWDLYLPFDGLHVTDLEDINLLPGNSFENYFLVFEDGELLDPDDIELDIETSNPEILPLENINFEFEDGVFSIVAETSQDEVGASDITLTFISSDDEYSQKFRIVSAPPHTISGHVVDFTRSQTFVYLDVNLDGQYNESEPNAISDQEGYFSFSFQPAALDTNENGRIETSEAILRAHSGVIMATGNPANTTFSAPVIIQDEDVVISSLTTLCVSLSQRNPQTNLNDIQQMVKSSLAIPIGIDLFSYNPFHQARDGDILAPEILARSCQLNTMSQLFSTIVGNQDQRTSQDVLFGTLTTYIENTLPLNLANQSILSSAFADNFEEGSIDKPSLMSVLADINRRFSTVANRNVSPQFVLDQCATLLTAVYGPIHNAFDRYRSGEWSSDFLLFNYSGEKLDLILNWMPNNKSYARDSVGIPTHEFTLGESGEIFAPLNLVRQLGSMEAIQVQVVLKSGSAQLGEDFDPVRIDITLDPGQVWTEVDLTPYLLSDELTEGTEFLTAQLESNTGLAHLDPSRISSPVYILDDDVFGSISFHQSSYTIFEDGRGSESIWVQRSGGYLNEETVLVTLMTGNPDQLELNFENTHDTIHFLSGEMVKKVSLTPINDSFYESDKDFSMHLSVVPDAQAQNLQVDILDNALLILKNDDNNSPPVIQPISDLVVSRNTQSIRIPFQVSDSETANTHLQFEAVVENPFIASSSNARFVLDQQQVILNLDFFENAFGSSEVWIIASDGRLSSQSRFKISIAVEDYSSIISPISNQSIFENSILRLPISINQDGIDINSLSFATYSSNTQLVTSQSLEVNGEGVLRELFVSPIDGRFGQTIISLDVYLEDKLLKSESFELVVAPLPVQLVISQSEGQTIIKWDGKGDLQSAPDPSGPWTSMENVTSPYSINMNQENSEFFRLIRFPE